MLTRVTIGILLAVAAAGPGKVLGQDPDATACPGCSISARQILRLGEDDGPGAISGMPGTVFRDGRGRYWVLQDNAPPMVYGPNGHFIRSIGRLGSGPGEFRSPDEGVALPGDSVLILDWLGGRASVIAPDLTIKRSITLPRRILSWGAVSLDWPDRIVVSAVLNTAESAGWPLHLLSMRTNKATVLRSFGSNDGEMRSSDLFHMGVNFAPASTRKTFWTVDDAQYVATEWDREGNRLRAIERRPRWFAAKSNLRMGGRSTPPSPIADAIMVDRNGLLWLFTRVPGKNWREAWANVPRLPPGTVGEMPASRGPAWQQLYQTNLEVVDSKGRVIATSQFSRSVVIGPIDHELVAEYHESSSGNPYVAIVRYSLVRPRSRSDRAAEADVHRGRDSPAERELQPLE